MAEHTPGPWRRGEYDEHAGYDCMTGGIRSGPVVLDANAYGQRRSWDGGRWDRERMEADANLIAAAPDLLAALEVAASWLRTVAREYNDSRFTDRYGEGPKIMAAAQMAEAAIRKARGISEPESER